MAILVTSASEHPEVEYFTGVLEERGIEVVSLDVTDWPGATVAWSPQDGHVTFDGRIDWERIDGAYVHPKSLFRSYSVRKFFDVDDLDDVFPAIHCMRDHRTVFESLFRTLESKDVDVLPRSRCLRLQMRKPWQLQQFEARGLPVPDTVFTNDPDRVRAFYDDHDQSVRETALWNLDWLADAEWRGGDGGSDDRVVVTVELDGEMLRLVVDDNLAVVDVDRTETG